MSEIFAGTTKGVVIRVGDQTGSVKVGSRAIVRLVAQQGLTAASDDGVLAHLDTKKNLSLGKTSRTEVVMKDLARGLYDGAPVWVAATSSGLALYEDSTLEEINILETGDARPSCLVARDDKLILGSEEGFLRSIALSSGEQETFFASATNAPFAALCLVGSTHFAGLRGDGALCIYDANDSDEQSFDVPLTGRALCSFSDGRAVVADAAGSLWAIDARGTREELARTKIAGISALSAWNDSLVLGTESGEVVVFSYANNTLTRVSRWTVDGAISAIVIR